MIPTSGSLSSRPRKEAIIVKIDTKFARLHQQRIEDGIINGWDLWQVINSRQTPFSHVVVTLTDISKMDSLYSGVDMQKVFPDMMYNDIKTFVKIILPVVISSVIT